jgi:fumarate hydratase subunit beta
MEMKMKNIKRIETPLTKDTVERLRAGDTVSINGIIYAARDAAHKKLISIINEGGELPFDVKDQIIYYVGPCPAKPGDAIGSAGPTTSSRMDAYTQTLIEYGLTGMIGKGYRSKEVVDAMTKYGAVYFGATGGAAALIAKSILSEEVIAFPELGPEAIRKLIVRDFMVTVVIDYLGNNLYITEREKYKDIL